jgi:hypothetical protein
MKIGSNIGNAKASNSLGSLYKGVTGKEPETAHSAEADSKTLATILLHKTFWMAHTDFLVPIFNEEESKLGSARKGVSLCTLPGKSVTFDSVFESKLPSTYSLPSLSSAHTVRYAIKQEDVFPLSSSELNAPKKPTKETIYNAIFGALITQQRDVKSCRMCGLPGTNKQTHPQHESLWNLLNSLLDKDQVYEYKQLWNAFEKAELSLALTKDMIIQVLSQHIVGMGKSLVKCGLCGLPGCNRTSHPEHASLWERLRSELKFKRGQLHLFEAYWSELIKQQPDIPAPLPLKSIKSSQSGSKSLLTFLPEKSVTTSNESMKSRISTKENAIEQIRSLLLDNQPGTRLVSCSECKLPGTDKRTHPEHQALWQKLEKYGFNQDALGMCKILFGA